MGTIVWVEGFDHYDVTTSATTNGGWSSESFDSQPAGRYGGYAAEGTQMTNYRAVPSDAEYTIAFDWYPNNTNIGQIIGFCNTSSNIHLGLDYTIATGVMTFGSSSFTPGIVNNVWAHIEIYAKIHATAGAYWVKVNGVEQCNVTNTDTFSSGSAVTDTFRVSSSTSQSVVLDNIVAMKGGGNIGQVRVVTQFPDADGANTAWAIGGQPYYQATGTLAQGTATISPAWPTHQAGDIGLLFLESAGGESISLSVANGFAEVTNSPQATGAGTAGTRLAVYWCRATSSSMSAPTTNDPGDHISGFIMTFRNCVTSGNPWDVTAGGVKGTGSTSFSDGGVTTTVNNCLIVVAGTDDDDAATANFDTWTNANLTSLTERYDNGTTQGNGGGIAVATGIKAASGSTGATTAVHVTSTTNAYLTIALKPPTGDFEQVDENLLGHDSDNSYLSTSNAGDRETFGFPDLGLTGSVTVKAVAITHMSRKDDAGTRLMTTVIRDTSGGGTNYDDASTDSISSTYAPYTHIYEQDPATSSAWTSANVDAREFGIKLET